MLLSTSLVEEGEGGVVSSALDFCTRLWFDAYLHLASRKFYCVELRTELIYLLLLYSDTKNLRTFSALTSLLPFLQPGIAIQMALPLSTLQSKTRRFDPHDRPSGVFNIPEDGS